MAFFTGRPGWQELLIVLLVLLLLFGAKKLPELARSIGKSINEFKKGRAESEDEVGSEGAKTPPEEAAPSNEGDETKG